MKIFDHPLHVMFIHFPIGLLPMELVLSFLAYKFQDPLFATAAFYCLMGGVATGYIAIITGLLDLIAIPKTNKIALGTGLLHGFINGTAVLIYSIFAYKAWKAYPQIHAPSLVLLLMKSLLVLCLLIGNFLGGKLIYKYHVGINKM